MTRRSNGARQEAVRLAQLLYSAESLCAVERTLPENADAPSRRSIAPSFGGDASYPAKRIGIWEQRSEECGVAFVRVECEEGWRMWADVERIAPKRGCRIVLLGESVARGFFYDPYFNPAKALERIIRRKAGADFEVVDLARTDLVYEQLDALLDAAPALDPDAIVVFAGNNWHVPGKAASLSLERIAGLVRDQRSWRPVSWYIESVVREKVAALLKKLGDLSCRLGIPAVFVVPEFNLADWRNEYCGQAPLLSSEQTHEWERHRQDAEGFLGRNDPGRALDLAARMVRIDQGTTPVGFDLIARCNLALGATQTARRYLEAARDASLSLSVPKEPRCYTVIQEELRRGAPVNGVHLVDLPASFAGHSGGELPGRRLFHDYCHLTAEAIGLAMSWTAAELLRHLGKPDRMAGDHTAACPVDPPVEAQAHLLAAIHNARCGQDGEIVRFHAGKSLQSWPAIAEAMMLYLDSHLQLIPALMCDSFMRMAQRNEALATYMSAGALGGREKELCFVLVEALTGALEAANYDVRSRTQHLLEGQHSISPGGSSLLKKTRFVAPFGTLEHEWQERAMYLQSYSANSQFRIVCSCVERIELEILFRVPCDTARGLTVWLSMNGVRLGEVAADTMWRTWTIAVPPETLRRGLNSMAIHWPTPVWSLDERVEEVAQKMEAGHVAGQRYGFPNIFRIYGEVHAFHAFDRALGERAAQLDVEPMSAPEVA